MLPSSSGGLLVTSKSDICSPPFRRLEVTAFRLLLRLVALARGAYGVHSGDLGHGNVPLGLEIRDGLAVGLYVDHHRSLYVLRRFERVFQLWDGARPDHVRP